MNSKNIKQSKKLFFSLFYYVCSSILLPIHLLGQLQDRTNILIIDKSDKKPVAYATVRIKNSKKGTYTDENGVFELSFKQTDTLEVSAIGYKNYVKAVNEFKEVIELTPDFQLLNKVIVKSGKKKSSTVNEIGFFSNKKNGHYTGIREAALFIESPNTFYQLSKVSFSFSSIKFSNIENKRIKNYEILVRLRIYDKLEGKFIPNHDILRQNITKVLEKGVNKVSFDTSEMDLKLPEGRFFIALEFLGYKNKDIFIADSPESKDATFQFSPVFSDNHIKPISFIKVGYGKDWKLFKVNSHQYNFNFGVSIEY